MGDDARGTVGLAVLEATKPLGSFDFSTADRWQVLVLVDGTPTARVEVPSPGAVDSAPLARALFLRHADDAIRRRALADRLRERLGGSDARSGSPPTRVSVVVCTHGRPEYLPTVLESLAAMDPPAHEIVVVDNAPGERDCRADVDRIGARYVREDTKGLDHARNAGVRAATGDAIAFTDDDCVVPPGWVSALQDGFASPLIAAVTGPAFPYVLDTPARVRMERQASLTRGLHRRVYDWTVLSPVHGAQVGVGANMAFRRDVLETFDGPFPGELDAGTLTRSGGDSYIFARLLAAGHRIAYEPAAYVFHQHRPDWERLIDAVAGYGTGAAAMAAKLLVEDRELEAPRAWAWLVTQYARTQVRRATGRADSVETRIAWSYLRGGLSGARAWRRALAVELDRESPTRASAAKSSSIPEPSARRSGRSAGRDGDLELSVIVPTVGRPEALQRCLGALSRQTMANAAFEIVVCDDTPPGGPSSSAVTLAPGDPAVTWIQTGGVGAAAARNAGAATARGRALLFLDDDLVPADDLVEQHLKARRTLGDVAVVGHSPPRPVGGGLAASGASLWWEEHFEALAATDTLGFSDMLSGNMSMSRERFRAIGGFDEAFGRYRREDWELGLRLRRLGIPIVYEPTAHAVHEFRLDAGARLRAAHGEGHGDARLVSIEPDATAYLPLAAHRPPSLRQPIRAAGFRVLASDIARPAVLAALRGLEAARLRSAWSRLYNRSQRAAYARGLREGGWRPAVAPPPPPSVPLELSSRARIKMPDSVVPPSLSLLARGRRCGEVMLQDGRWHPGVAERIAGKVPARVLAQMVEQPREQAVDAASPIHEGVVVIADAPNDEIAAVAALEPAPSDPAGFWTAVQRRLERADWEYLAIALPGRAPSRDWLRQALVAFDGPSVGAVAGRAVDDGRPDEPLSLAESRRGRLPFAPLGSRLDFIVLRRSALPELKLSLADLASVNELAPAGWLVEATLDDGWLVAHGGVRGMTVARGSAATQRGDKLVAWAALAVLSGAASALGPRLVVGAPLLAVRRARRASSAKGSIFAVAGPIARGAIAGRRLARRWPGATRGRPGRR